MIFGRRQKKAAPVAHDGDNDEDVSAREDAAAVASEIEAAVRDDHGGTGKDKRGSDSEGLDATKTAVIVCLALIILFAPNPFMDTNPPPSREVAFMNKMVEDCSKRLQLCQVQLKDCQGKGNCSPKAMAVCDKLIHLCSSINGRTRGAPLQQQQQHLEPAMMQQQQQVQQQFQQQPAMMHHQQEPLHQEDSFQHLQEAEAMHHEEPIPHKEDSFQHLQEAEMMHQEEPVHHHEEDSFHHLQEAEAMHHQEEEEHHHHVEEEPVHKQHQEEEEEPVHKQHQEAAPGGKVHPAEVHREGGAAVAPVQQRQKQQQQQEAGGGGGAAGRPGGTCKEAGMLLGGVCTCPALHAPTGCPAGQAAAPGTCACQGGMTTPFEHKDHVSKLSKRELPQAFSGPAVLDRENPALRSGIKVHLPGKEPAWKKIGKVSTKEVKMLPAQDPVGGRVYGSCAIVGNSGVMLLEAKGKEIDSHDFVMRFNGAPTAGLERFVGSKTTVRIVNHSWQDYRETKDEIVLSHLRGPHHLEDFKLRRKANGDSEKWFLFSPDFSNYAAQTAYEVATYFGINLQAEGEQAWTPTGGWTGIVMALNLCSKVDIYGFHISERHGVPYHYHNRCPQPFAHRDSAEWMMIQSFHKHGLVEFRDPCLLECHESDEACQQCKGKNPVPRSVYESGKAMWQKGPMPEYCSARLEWLKKEEKAGRCQGLCGKFEKKTDWGKP